MLDGQRQANRHIAAFVTFTAKPMLPGRTSLLVWRRPVGPENGMRCGQISDSVYRPAGHRPTNLVHLPKVGESVSQDIDFLPTL